MTRWYAIKHLGDFVDVVTYLSGDEVVAKYDQITQFGRLC